MTAKTEKLADTGKLYDQLSKSAGL